MNSIQRYVLDSLFAQNQITANSLAKAIGPVTCFNKSSWFACEANVFKLFESIN